jgi:hypothetical protein
MVVHFMNGPNRRVLCLFSTLILIVACGCGSGGSGVNTGGGDATTPPTVPTITSMIPSLAIAGSAQISIAVQGSNFLSGAVVKWNGLALTTSGSGIALSAIVPQTYLASAETVQITVENPSPGGGLSGPQTFTVAAAPPPTYVRTVAQIPDAKDILADPPRGLLYLSMPATDPLYPNSIVSLDPVAAGVSKTTPTGQGPYMMSASLDDSHLWVTLDGDYALERFSLPALTPEFTTPAPLVGGAPQQVVSLDAGAVDPRSAAIVVGLWAIYPPYNGVYIFDDDVQRPGNLPAWMAGGPPIAWARWGPDDSVLYGGYDFNNGSISILNVASSGITFEGSNGDSAPWRPVMDRKRNILYDNALGVAYDPPTGKVLGRFPLPGSNACTEDDSLQRYYCATAYFNGGSNVLLYDLWEYDLNSYQFIQRINFGWRSSGSGGGNSAFTGQPRKLVRWGNAGRALITTDDNTGFGPSGLFLFDGSAVNPNVPPDVSSGTPGAPCVGETGLCNPF